MYGKVTRYFQDKGYGFILGEDGNSYFIHRSNLGGECLARGYRVYETLNYYLNDYYTGWTPDSYRRTEAGNPKTGEPCIVPDRRRVKFYPSETLAGKIGSE